jgi:hypothetical protein
MAKAKLTNLAQVLLLVQTLTDSEKATLRDVLRPAPVPRGAKKPTKKPKASADAAPLLTSADASDENEPKCAACGNPESYTDHFQPSPHYHPFESSKKKRVARATA